MLDRCLVGLQLDIEIAKDGKRRGGFRVLAGRAFEKAAGCVVVVNGTIRLGEIDFGGAIARRDSEGGFVAGDRVSGAAGFGEREAERDAQISIVRG